MTAKGKEGQAVIFTSVQGAGIMAEQGAASGPSCSAYSSFLEGSSDLDLA